MAMARHPFSTATQMVTYPIGTISEQLACRRNTDTLTLSANCFWVSQRDSLSFLNLAPLKVCFRGRTPCARFAFFSWFIGSYLGVVMDLFVIVVSAIAATIGAEPG